MASRCFIRRTVVMLLLLLLLMLLFVANVSAAAKETECEVGPDGSSTCRGGSAVETADPLSLLLPGMTIKSQDDDDGSLMVDTGFGVDQQAVGAQKEKIMTRFQEIQQYMNDRVLKASTDDILSTVASECQLRHELCSFWAVIGECEVNPGMFCSVRASMRLYIYPCMHACVGILYYPILYYASLFGSVHVSLTRIYNILLFQRI